MFNLCLAAGELDWEAARSEMPDRVLRGWAEFHRREPQGTGRLYEFLSHAFCRLAKAFHSFDYANDLESHDFQWWVPRRELTEDEEAELDLDDDAIERHMDYMAALRASGGC